MTASLPGGGSGQAELERPRWRATANHAVWPTLQLGVEYNRGRVGLLVTWFSGALEAKLDELPAAD